MTEQFIITVDGDGFVADKVLFTGQAIYKVSCYSTCGSYFGSYLQSVTVIASDKASAVEVVKKWLDKEGRWFIYPEDKWDVRKISDIRPNTVVDEYTDSDY